MKTSVGLTVESRGPADVTGTRLLEWVCPIIIIIKMLEFMRFCHQRKQVLYTGTFESKVSIEILYNACDHG